MSPNALRLAAILSMLFIAAGCSPTHPSSGYAPALKSIRYVRTRPVTRPASPYGVMLNYDIPILGDPFHRSRLSVVGLRAVDGTTFVYDYPNNFSDLPADTECSFWVSDAAVSENSVARDIYVNDTPIRVETLISALNQGIIEYGRFKVSEDGRVY